jgi:transcriptional regulator with XRE-family HTH domain
MKLGNTVKKLRKERHLTLSDLSKQSGIQMATLSRIENHKANGSVNNYFRIAEALDMKLSELFLEYENDCGDEYDFSSRRCSANLAGSEFKENLFKEAQIPQNLKDILGEASSINIKMVSVNFK